VTDFAPGLPADDHVHTQWSWDTDAGDMERTCARAVELGLPSVAFTEHSDVSSWTVPDESWLPETFRQLVTNGVMTPPPLDVDGYLASVERCRDLFPSLRIVTGVEMSEPHWAPEYFDALLAGGRLQRRLASVHSLLPLPSDDGPREIFTQSTTMEPTALVRDYLAEIVRLVEGYDDFEVLAHIDYPVRYWPGDGPAYDPADFADDYRGALRALARSGRVLELNTRLPLHPQVLAWWRAEGGPAISFASDAHRPELLAHGFAEAARVARAAGYRPGNDPHDFWVRD
jgi:histidinol-phosphatase (PHP family)